MTLQTLRSRRSTPRFPAILLVVILTAGGGSSRAADDLGIRVPEGFQVSLYADNDLAPDIFSMSLDAQGRVVVSGPGYVRILKDINDDGRAESFQQFADGPATGAQGLCFQGRDLLCTGDEGILRYRDLNCDDTADGPPDLVLKVKAGGEHDAHAIRRGPDGWWYVIAGNMSQVDERYAGLASSPVRRPRHGVLLRLKPDFSGVEVVSHGYRNAYDFDFNVEGDLLTFDSDGERESSLPAYQPTRVLQASPGSHAGWFSDHWKRSRDFFDMPPVVAEFGRASPTGVVCYRHTAFPEPYRGALFVLDWTFGRIFALPAERTGSAVVSRKPIPFVTTVGEHGFAPTDIEVSPDGSLYVCVGGRGTRGGVYRISATKPIFRVTTPPDKLLTCLDAPQPLAGWSRANWEPLAERLGAAAFNAAVVNEKMTPARRVRAIEILTEKFGGVDGPVADRIVNSPSAAVRACLAWSIGRTRPEDPSIPILQTLLRDRDLLVLRKSLETALSADAATLDAVAEEIGAALGSSDRPIRMAAVRVLARMSRAGYSKASTVALTKGPQAGLALAVSYSHRHPGYQTYSLDIARRLLESNVPNEMKLDAARLMQMGLGDVGAIADTIPQAFEGYTSRVDLSPHAAELGDFLAAVDKSFPSGHTALDRELGRIVAMLQPNHPGLLQKLTGKLTVESDPVDDIHWLLVLARMNTPRTPEATAAIASGLLRLEGKIQKRSLLIDTHWDEQINEIYAALVDRDDALPIAILAHPDFGRPSHTSFVAALPLDKLNDAVAAFVRQIKADADYVWNGEVIFLLSRSDDPEIQQLVRSKFDDYSLRSAILVSISESPREEDRKLFVAGLENMPADAMAVCAESLLKLPPNTSADEQVTLVRALRSLGDQRAERKIRNRIIERLEMNNQMKFEADDADQSVSDRWTAFVKQKHPDEFARQSGDSAADSAHLDSLLAGAEWSTGEANRGRKLFESRSCIQCHSGRGAVGPDLNGAAQRFSRNDLFTAIANPSRDVSPRYQTTAITTKDGRSLTGLVIYESVDYVVIRNAANQTSRIEKKNVDDRRTLSQSLMPNGLLKGLGPSDLADLYAYLRGMGATATATAAGSGESAK